MPSSNALDSHVHSFGAPAGIIRIADLPPLPLPTRSLSKAQPIGTGRPYGAGDAIHAIPIPQSRRRFEQPAHIKLESIDDDQLARMHDEIPQAIVPQATRYEPHTRMRAIRQAPLLDQPVCEPPPKLVQYPPRQTQAVGDEYGYKTLFLRSPHHYFDQAPKIARPESDVPLMRSVGFDVKPRAVSRVA